MPLESTNDWVIKDKVEYPYYDTPINVLLDPSEIEPPKLNQVVLNMYKGSTFKTQVRYLVAMDATDEEVEIAMWDAINKAKTDYLQERYS